MSDPNPQPQPAPPPAAPAPHGLAGIAADPSTLASTGLLAAVLFSVVAGVLELFTKNAAMAGFPGHLLNLTDTVDLGDVAILGIAVALLLLTPDPPGGVDRSLLLRADAALAGVITVFGVVRSLVLIARTADTGLIRFGNFVTTLGVAVAAATVGFYAATESFLKKKGRI